MTENLLLFSKLNSAKKDAASKMAGLLISTELREKFKADNKIIANVKKRSWVMFSLHLWLFVFTYRLLKVMIYPP